MPKRISPAQLLDIDARRICLIKPSALGDVVQTLPLLPALRERFRGAKIAWVINSQLAGLLEGHPGLDEVIPFDRRSSWAGWMRLLGDLRLGRFDLVFDLQGLLRTAIMTWATGAGVRVGLETAREGSQLACNCTIPDTGRQVPAHLRYWRVAEAIGMGDLRRETIVAVTPDDRDWVRGQLEVLRSPILAVQPGARWVTKRYPVEKFAVVAARAMRVYGFSTVILGAGDEMEAAARLEQLLRRLVPAAKPLNLVGRTTLKQLAAVLQQSDCALTNDSGPMHLAAGLGVPVLGIFTCTSPLRSGPPGERHQLVSTTVRCAASYKKRCPHSGAKHMRCMDDLSAELVWGAFTRLVKTNRLDTRAA